MYGYIKATPQDKEVVRKETCLAMRLLSALKLCIRNRRPCLLVVPHLSRKTPTSMMQLPEYCELRTDLHNHFVEAGEADGVIQYEIIANC